MIKSKTSRYGDYFVVVLCVFMILIFFLPVWNVFVRSFSSPQALIRSEVYLWPVEIDFTAYSLVLKDTTYTWSLAWDSHTHSRVYAPVDDHDHIVCLSAHFPKAQGTEIYQRGNYADHVLQRRYYTQLPVV